MKENFWMPGLHRKHFVLDTGCLFLCPMQTRPDRGAPSAPVSFCPLCSLVSSCVPLCPLCSLCSLCPLGPLCPLCALVPCVPWVSCFPCVPCVLFSVWRKNKYMAALPLFLLWRENFDGFHCFHMTKCGVFFARSGGQRMWFFMKIKTQCSAWLI